MNFKWAIAAIAAIGIGSWNTSSAQDRPVFRAQGGSVVYPETHPVYHEGGYYGDECDDEAYCSPFGRCWRCWTYIATLGGPQRGGYAGRDPRQLDYQYLYRYKAPKDLKYPPANQPAGVVVYPYYTVKGPDDFFLNETLGN